MKPLSYILRIIAPLAAPALAAAMMTAFISAWNGFLVPPRLSHRRQALHHRRKAPFLRGIGGLGQSPLEYLRGGQRREHDFSSVCSSGASRIP